MFDRPTLFTLGPGTQHQGAVMTLEAVEMIVLVQSSDSRCLGLTLLWNDWKLACGADQGEHSEAEKTVNCLIFKLNNRSW